jgi:hypothetical protein
LSPILKKRTWIEDNQEQIAEDKTWEAREELIKLLYLEASQFPRNI